MKYIRLPYVFGMSRGMTRLETLRMGESAEIVRRDSDEDLKIARA